MSLSTQFNQIAMFGVTYIHVKCSLSYAKKLMKTSICRTKKSRNCFLSIKRQLNLKKKSLLWAKIFQSMISFSTKAKDLNVMTFWSLTLALANGIYWRRSGCPRYIPTWRNNLYKTTTSNWWRPKLTSTLSAPPYVVRCCDKSSSIDCYVPHVPTNLAMECLHEWTLRVSPHC